MNYLSKLTYVFIILTVLTFGLASAQDEATTKKVNFGYSTNPVAKSSKDKKDSKPENVKAAKENKPDDNSSQKNIENTEPETEIPLDTAEKGNFQTVAQKTLDIAKRANKASLPPTEIYKVGIGDVLFISLQSVPSQTAKYYTVLDDGTIDYPLAGELVSVLDFTTDEIEEFLRNKIKLYENPEVSVKVREHASHKISVLGSVEKPGEKFLQREAVPLYVVRAEAIVRPDTQKVIIKRSDSKTEEFQLNDVKYSDVLVFPGDIVEFIGNQNSARSNGLQEFYYIGGEVKEGGQMEFHEGITLTQAILASGGLKDEDVKKVIVRRKDDKGFLKSETYNLKDIKKGKSPDPLLQVGDTVEVGL